MDITEAKTRRAAGKAIRAFEKQVAEKRDRAFIILDTGADPVGRIDATDITLRLDATEMTPVFPTVYVTATIEATRSRHDEHLADEDVDRVARAAYADGRTELVERDFLAAVTTTPTPVLDELTRDIKTILGWTTPELDFHVHVVVGEWTEDVAALGFNTWTDYPEDFLFASRAQARLDQLHEQAYEFML